MDIIYHIVPDADWEKFNEQAYYEAGSLQTEGFIHLSRHEQIEGVLSRYYQGVPDLLLLHIDADTLTPELIYEVATNNERFPHLYGPINKDAVVAVQRLT
ncbi:DUF952 domain-containing protein [Spirosoma knui]